MMLFMMSIKRWTDPLSIFVLRIARHRGQIFLATMEQLWPRLALDPWIGGAWPLWEHQYVYDTADYYLRTSSS